MQFMVNPSVGGLGVHLLTGLTAPCVIGVVEEWMWRRRHGLSAIGPLSSQDPA